MASSVFEHAIGNAPGHCGLWRPRLRWRASPLDRLKTHAVEFARLQVLGTITVYVAFNYDRSGGSARMPDDRSQEYRRLAAECMELARRGSDLQVRAALVIMSQRWFEQAELAERALETVSAVSGNLNCLPPRAPISTRSRTGGHFPLFSQCSALEHRDC
jgi:hypothetical protein